jgi:rubrerythrin
MLSDKFNVIEMLEMAKEIEDRGYRLYSTHAKETDDAKLKKIFNKLASDEKDHFNTFDKLEKEYKDKKQKDYSYLERVEVNDYLQSLVQFEVFPQGESEELKEMDTAQVLDRAIQSEKDSILLYRELIPYNEGKTKEVLEQLINEEKEHYVSLVNYKKEYID